eukprot:TRINITY_DN7951_c0_g5_i1.p1 TRINITY_DN7951_c0_g5~~TRINITY_DN7951_c0_g5_i1.p1  ORF type:complete len:158 (-),score=17.15 TRINITY_DN7951_c0_g5_i1:17-490(-)
MHKLGTTRDESTLLDHSHLEPENQRHELVTQDNKSTIRKPQKNAEPQKVPDGNHLKKSNKSRLESTTQDKLLSENKFDAEFEGMQGDSMKTHKAEGICIEKSTKDLYTIDNLKKMLVNGESHEDADPPCTLRCYLSLIHICRCRRIERCRSRWSPYH